VCRDFEPLEALGPVFGEAHRLIDPVAAVSLAVAFEPGRARLEGERAAVLRQLINGRRTRLEPADTPEARPKRRERNWELTPRSFGRGESKTGMFFADAKAGIAQLIGAVKALRRWPRAVATASRSRINPDARAVISSRSCRRQSSWVLRRGLASPSRGA
jgi:hypothetical protein